MSCEGRRVSRLVYGQFCLHHLKCCDSGGYLEAKAVVLGWAQLAHGGAFAAACTAAAAPATPAPACLHSARLSSLGSFTPDDGGSCSSCPCGSCSAGCDASGHGRSSSVLPMMA